MAQKLLLLAAKTEPQNNIIKQMIPQNIFEAIANDSFSLREFSQYIIEGSRESMRFADREYSPLKLAIDLAIEDGSPILSKKIRILIEASYLNESLGINPFEQYNDQFSLLEILLVKSVEDVAIIVLEALSEEDQQRIFRPENFDSSAVEIAVLHGCDNFLSCLVHNKEELQALRGVIVNCNVLSHIYNEPSADKQFANQAFITQRILESRTLKNLDYKHLKSAAQLLMNVAFDDKNVFLPYKFGDQTFSVLRAPHADHVAFFIVDCDQSDAPQKISYCDAWQGIFGMNEDRYSFGETTFAIYSSKIKTLKKLELIIKSGLEKETYSLEKISETLKPFVACDASGDLRVIEKHIPTVIQSRSNCFTKSTFIAMRSLARRMRPECKDDFKWTPDFETQGFPSFKASDIGGAERRLYKSFKNDFIDESIAALQESVLHIRNQNLLGIVKNYATRAFSRTERKQSSLDAAEPEESPIRDAEIYARRREALAKCLMSIELRQKELRVSRQLVGSEEDSVIKKPRTDVGVKIAGAPFVNKQHSK